MTRDEEISNVELLFSKLDRYHQMLLIDFMRYMLDEIDDGTLLVRKDEFIRMLTRLKDPALRKEQLETLNNKLQKLENKNG